MFSDKVIGLIRTAVPAAVGSIVTAIAAWVLHRYGITLDLNGIDGYLAPAAVTLVSGAYYAGARWLQTRFPKSTVISHLLGHPAVPTYSLPKK
jgi:hypothetical protein